MPIPTHVLFDFFGTLVAYSESRAEQGYPLTHEVLREAGCTLDYAAFLAQWDATFVEFDDRSRVHLDEFSIDEACDAFLRRALPQAPETEVISRFRDAFLKEWSKGVTYIPGVHELLTELAERCTLVLVTNTHHADMVHGHLQAMGIDGLFDTVVTSVEHGKRKPSHCIFDVALQRSRGAPESALYVGDSYEADYLGARGAGLRCLLIDPQRHAIPHDDRIAGILELSTRVSG